MRLRSLHPQYLDSKGLVALWRESLLAKHVLEGKTKGYRHHPQLERFRSCTSPLGAINFYLYHIEQEATQRGYRFDSKKIDMSYDTISPLCVTDGQVRYEKQWLEKKLITRDPSLLQVLQRDKQVILHPLFRLISGPIATREKVG